MGLLSELLHNAVATYRLQPRYYRLTTAVGLVAGAVGVALIFCLGGALAAWLDVAMDAPIRGQASGSLWIALFLLGIPFVFYFSGVVVAAVFGAVFVRLGLLTPDEARHYALRSRYPQRWFK